jgi:hypothetical protein
MAGMIEAQNNGIYDAETRDPNSATATSFRRWCHDTFKPPEGAHAGWNLYRDGAGTMVPPGPAPGVQDGSANRRAGLWLPDRTRWHQDGCDR